MKTSIKYYNSQNSTLSSCGDVLNIEKSSTSLQWEGVLLEKGTSPYFHPKNVETHTFYFALELSRKYEIDIVSDRGSLTSYMQPDTIWFNPPFTPFTHNINEPCDFIIVTITPEKMRQGFGHPLPHELLFLNNYSLQDPILVKLIQLLYIEVNSVSKNRSWYIEHIIGLLSNHVIRNYSNYEALQSSQLFQPFSEKELQILSEYINSHISEVIQIQELADLVNMNKFYFLKEFKKVTNITPYQYIIHQKINHSKQLLIDTKKSITSIAQNLGFNDSSHFSKTFKQHENMTPKQYRDNLK